MEEEEKKGKENEKIGKKQKELDSQEYITKIENTIEQMLSFMKDVEMWINRGIGKLRSLGDHI